MMSYWREAHISFFSSPYLPISLSIFLFCLFTSSTSFFFLWSQESVHLFVFSLFVFSFFPFLLRNHESWFLMYVLCVG